MGAQSGITYNYYTLSQNRLYLSTGTGDLHSVNYIIKPITVGPQLSGPTYPDSRLTHLIVMTTLLE